MRTLQQLLDEAIAGEHYELAARLRDAIAERGPDAYPFQPGGELYMTTKSWFMGNGATTTRGLAEDHRGFTVRYGPLNEALNYTNEEDRKRAERLMKEAGERGEAAGREFRTRLQGAQGYELPMDRAQWDFEEVLKKCMTQVRAELERVITEMDGVPPNSYSAAQHGVRIVDHRDQTETYVWRGKTVLKVSYSLDGWRICGL